MWAKRAAAAVLKQHCGEMWWPSGVPSAGPNPSLLIGMAGIGHMLLRWTYPDLCAEHRLLFCFANDIGTAGPQPLESRGIAYGASLAEVMVMRVAWLSVFSLTAGCTAPLFETNPDSTVMWIPDEVTLTRYPAKCGVADPPFDDLDSYDLFLYDTRGPEGTPQTAIAIDFVRTDLVNVEYPIALAPFHVDLPDQQDGATAVNTTSNANGDVNFWYERGQRMPDRLPLAAVTVTFAAFPSEDGDELVAHASVWFNDGGVCSFTARPTLPSAGANLCPRP
ncbi:MAG: hypothetical protein ABI467_22235 [Kofleriaceae bacterium]